jgi:hypothetical protein
MQGRIKYAGTHQRCELDVQLHIVQVKTRPGMTEMLLFPLSFGVQPAFLRELPAELAVGGADIMTVSWRKAACANSSAALG